MVESLILVILMELHFILPPHCWLVERVIFDDFSPRCRINPMFAVTET